MARVVGESRLRARRRRKVKVYIALASGGAIFLVGGFIALLWAPFWRVRAIDVSGASTVPAASIQQAAQAQLAGRYALMFPKNSILLYPRQSVERSLLSQFPTLASVRVSGENLHAIAISVSERQPASLWCGQAFASSSDCFYMDSGGFVYAPAADYSGGVYQKYFGFLAASSTQTNVGQYLSPEKFRSLFALVGALAAKVPGDSVAGLWVEPDGDADLFFTSGFTLLFNSTDDSGDVLNRFTLALQADVFAAHPLSAFQYLDLRFGNKLYYKLKTS